MNDEQRTSGNAADWAQAERNKQASGILAFTAALQIRRFKLLNLFTVHRLLNACWRALIMYFVMNKNVVEYVEYVILT